MEPIIEVKNLNVTIHKKRILNNITFPIYRNQITAIIGTSGCGKTTLLKSLNRSVENDGVVINGIVTLEKRNIFDRPEQEIRKTIGLICQKPSPFPFSVYKNMSYALNYYGLKDSKELREIILENLKRVGLYDEVSAQLQMDARNLSGGQQQRLCIARSLAVNPKVLLLDEPCSALDIKNILKIENTLRQIKEKYTIVIVTHNLSQAQRIADYTLFMENGEALEFGTTKQIFKSPANSRTREYMSYVL
ncbi:MAG: phosphate ABC transporter ATP-binding protein [Clostridiaceae bacterium]